MLNSFAKDHLVRIHLIILSNFRALSINLESFNFENLYLMSILFTSIFNLFEHAYSCETSESSILFFVNMVFRFGNNLFRFFSFREFYRTFVSLKKEISLDKYFLGCKEKYMCEKVSYCFVQNEYCIEKVAPIVKRDKVSFYGDNGVW